MIVTIDGPAGAGKSSAAHRLADRLGYRFLDTGAMYRAITYAGLQHGIDLTDEKALLQVALASEIQLAGDKIVLDEVDITNAIRTFEITTLTRHAADNRAVREHLTQLQRQFAAESKQTGQGIVTEGRDQATVVFPDAECKIYLTASEQARAQRRYEDLLNRGEQVDYTGVLEKQRHRDQQDLNRKVGGLALTNESIEVSTDDMTPDQVVDALEKIVRDRQPS
ncbi:(d)CMP kinase [Adhaeretor mobilis]|uniref:Cytidylate kinase n=1 Tax=Adhaeretor mobilis TaxID=1930276 RepID=A0A517MSX7_9BACT|nr:(d)CMP kinase [Adhaeretor mobilis]QDS97993.1 Cytidylate kinase [Adhaeretor mobilis]